jgi:hypothetical protein
VGRHTLGCAAHNGIDGHLIGRISGDRLEAVPKAVEA